MVHIKPKGPEASYPDSKCEECGNLIRVGKKFIDIQVKIVIVGVEEDADLAGMVGYYVCEDCLDVKLDYRKLAIATEVVNKCKFFIAPIKEGEEHESV